MRNAWGFSGVKLSLARQLALRWRAHGTNGFNESDYVVLGGLYMYVGESRPF
jgi:hypothetical protein